MEIIRDNDDTAKTATDAGEGSVTEKSDDSVLFAAYRAARDEVDAEAAEQTVSSEKPDDVVDSASSSEEAKSDPVVAAAAGDGPEKPLSGALADIGPDPMDVKVLRRHREEFLDAVVSGRRYVETFKLYGGRLVLKIRCRSADETEALEAYARRKVSSGEVKYANEYSALMRKLLMTAQVAEVNGVEYEEMKAPYKFVETADGLVPPAWESQLSVWDGRTDAWISAVVGAIAEFEARYWRMVSMSSDENFWDPGESTGE